MDKPAISALICQRLMLQAEYQSASTVMWYVHCRSEVQTLPAIREALKMGQRVVVPYCTLETPASTPLPRDGINQSQGLGEKCLGLWRLEHVDELQPGLWGILEPPCERWFEAGRQVAVDELDVVVVPGVAFDRQGGRLGNGAGYYDRLLARVRRDCWLVGIGYESQLLPCVEKEAHDVLMDVVITEMALYAGKRWGR